MKWLTTILSLYLLGLSLWPCADEALPVTGQGMSVVLTKAGIPHSGTSHEHHDQCSPLCTCACCAATLTVEPCFAYSLNRSSESIPAIAAATFTYTPLHWGEPFAAIWQPPKRRV